MGRFRAAGFRSIIGAAVLAAAFSAAAAPPLLTNQDLPMLAAAPAGIRIAYGPDPLQFGELTLPKGRGPFPVMVWVHGGCWLSGVDLAHSRSLAQAMAARGFAVWSVEYRRIGSEGGGWPNTFKDVASGADHVRKLAKPYRLDLSHLIIAGHSAGGELALWLAGRSRIGRDSPLWSATPLVPRGVLALAPATGLSALYAKNTCDGVVGKLIGGGPEQFPDRYKAAEPNLLLPLGIPQALVVGALDPKWNWLGEQYFAAATRVEKPGAVTITRAPESGHFELISPESSTWPLVLDALDALKQRM